MKIKVWRQKYEDTKEVIRRIKRKIDNTMATLKKTKGQTTIYKTLHRKLKIEQLQLRIIIIIIIKIIIIIFLGWGLLCLTPLSTIIQLYRGGQIY